LGNLRDLTAKELWLPAHKWAKQYGELRSFTRRVPTAYTQLTLDRPAFLHIVIPPRICICAHPPYFQPGDVVYVHVFGQGLVFLNSPEAAFDLLDKRGAIYSDKPQLVMTGEL
jgi:hypothetical protein